MSAAYAGFTNSAGANKQAHTDFNKGIPVGSKKGDSILARTVIGLFDNLDQAQRVVQQLVDAGFNRDDIGIVRSNQRGGTTTTNANNEKSDVGKDAGWGAVLGGVAGLVVGLAALAIPGIGPIVAAGPIAAALGGAGIGAVAGGLIGALVGLGVPEEHAQYYAEGIKRGGTLVTVKSPDNMVQRAVDIMNNNGAIDIEKRAAEWRQAGWTPATAAQTTTQPAATATTQQTPVQTQTTTTQKTPAQTTTTSQTQQGETLRVPVVEEQMNVEKQAVSTGGVRIYTTVEEKPVRENVTLHEEKVNVERRPVDRPLTDADRAALQGNQAFQEKTFDVNERVEKPVVTTQPRVVEEVVVNKQVQERTVPVEGTVRQTQVHVEELPGEQVPAGFTNMETNFRNHFNQNYNKSGATYEQYRPAYQYGYTLASNPQYKSGQWNQYEPQFRQQWEQQYPNNAWNQYRDVIMYGWNRGRNPNQTQ